MGSTFRHSVSQPQFMSADAGPEDVAVLARQAAQHASRGEYGRALTGYREALLLDDTRADLWFNFALLQRRMGLGQDAAEGFEFALRLDPALYAARYCLAKLLFEQGQPLAAIAHFEQVVKQNPGYAPAWRNLGELRMGLGDLAEAHECLHEALLRAPHDEETVVLMQKLVALRRPAAHG